MRTQRILKTIIGVVVIIGILVGMGIGIHTLLNSTKSAFYFDANPSGETMEAIVVEDIIVDKGTKVILPIPERVGYSFDGWYLDRDCSGSYYRGGEEVTANSNKTLLYAKWSIKKYKVQLINDYASDPESMRRSLNVSYKKSINLDSYASQDEEIGYDYSWKASDDTIVEDSTNVVIEEEVTFTRVRLPKTYKLKFLYIDGEDEVVLDETKTLEFGRPFSFDGVDTSRTGYKFKGNFILEDDTVITEETTLTKDILGVRSGTIVLYAQYDVEQYKVNFYSWDNVLLGSYTYDYNQTISADDLQMIESNAGLSREHYRFKGWKCGDTAVDTDTFTVPAEDVNLVADYDKQRYTITYYINHGERLNFAGQSVEYEDSLEGTVPTDQQIADIIGENGDAYRLSRLKYNGVTYTKEQFEETFTSIDVDMDIEIVLEKYKLFINYISGDGVSIYRSALIDKDRPIVLPDAPDAEHAPTSTETGTSYEFGGWILADGTAFDADYDVNDITTDLNVYSEWFEYNYSKWSAVKNADGNTLSVTGYLGDYKNICVPTQVLVGANYLDVTRIGSVNFVTPITGVENRKILIKSNISSIGAYAFYNQNTSVVFDNAESDRYLSIDEYAFASVAGASEQKSVTTIKLPKRTYSVDVHAFNSAINLTSVEVASGCTYYKSVDGVLYETKNNAVVLHTYPHSRQAVEFVVPSDVTKIGENAFYYYKGTNAVESKLTKVSTGEDSRLSAIGVSAFYSMTTLKSVNFATANIDTIGESAFEKCFSIGADNDGFAFSSTYPISEIGNKAFYNCSYTKKFSAKLTQLSKLGESAFMNFSGSVALNETNLSAEIGGALTAIPKDAFAGARLTLTISDNSVTSIGETAFRKAKIKRAIFPLEVALGTNAFKEANITYIQLDNVPTIKADTFSNTILNTVIVDRLNTVEDKAFQGNTSIETFEMGANCTLSAVSKYMFEGATNLKNVTLSSSVKKTNISAFEGCTALTEITLPEGFEETGYSAFNGCKKLAKVNTPTTLTTIGSLSFKDCVALKTIAFNSKLKTVNSRAFEGSGLTAIKLEMVDTTSSGTLISGAFEGCAELVSADISVNAINDDAFKGCAKLKFVHINFNNQNSGLGALFGGCDSLEKIVMTGYVPNIKDTTESLYLFKGCNMLNKYIYVPTDTIDTYTAKTCWAEYALYLKEIDCSDGLIREASGRLLKATDNTSTLRISGVSSLSDYAFAGLSNLKILELDTTDMLLADNFDLLFAGVDTSELVIRVPKNLLASYRGANLWEPLVDKFVGVDF